MKSDSGQNVSLWMATAEVPARRPLDRDESADVCIVGAGIVGLTTAYLLSREGKSVIVLDDGPIAGGETSRTTGHLASGIDEHYTDLERQHGEENARLAAASHARAIDVIEEICVAEQIDCDFQRVDGYLFAPPGDSPRVLEEEVAAAHRAGLAGVEFARRLPYDEYDFGPAVRFPNQGQFHVLKYIDGLVRAIERRGGRIFTDTHVLGAGKGSAPLEVQTEDGHPVTADAVVFATNTPINDRVTIHTKQMAYRTYVIAARIPRGSVKPMLMWDTLDPYHYVRIAALGDGDDALLVGGEDHKTGQAADFGERYTRLEQWARERFPTIGEVVHRWSGQVMEPADGLAFIGSNPTGPAGVYIATGDSGNGLTHGTIAGLLLTDLIGGRENAWAKLYDPARKPLHALGEFAKENLNTASHFVDHVTPGEVKTADYVEPGSGAVIRRGLKKIAVYRDESGTLHEHLAVCPHLGCIVAWNRSEQTWDCPCHGSRFDKVDGHAVNGPAISGLARIEETEEAAV